MSRDVQYRYEDPLDRVWLDAASRIGLKVGRTPHAYAMTDGRGALLIGEADTLDADDSLAQMIFHELCHSLVEGALSFEEPDWGLDNESDRDLDRERACLRVQASLARRYGLRRFLAPTTDHRAFYDALGVDPLEGEGPSVPLARMAWTRSRRAPWAPHLSSALVATETIVRAVAATAPGSLHSTIDPPAARHPIEDGVWVHVREGLRCGECGWRRDGVCVAHDRPAEVGWPACERFERDIECGSCGACCREAFDTVEIDPDDPFVGEAGALLRRADGRISLPRVDGRCPLLGGDGGAAPFRCTRYAVRPRTCRELEREGPNCHFARQRVGVSL